MDRGGRECKVFWSSNNYRTLFASNWHGHCSIIKFPTWPAAIDEQWWNSEERTSWTHPGPISVGAWIINGIDCGGHKSRQSIIAHEGPFWFWLFLFQGAHKRPLVNILKGHRAEMGLMAGFDFWLIATSNRPGRPVDRGGRWHRG